MGHDLDQKSVAILSVKLGIEAQAAPPKVCLTGPHTPQIEPDRGPRKGFMYLTA